MKEYTRVCARIDLDAIEYNMDQMHETVGDATKIMAVVKMDGYGHGAIPIACDLEKKNYLWGFATATPDEGVILRANGIRKPILVLGPVFPSQQAEAIEHEIRFTCYTKEIAEQISETAVKLGKTAYVHIKLDTGRRMQIQSQRLQSFQALRWKECIHISPKQMKQTKLMPINSWSAICGCVKHWRTEMSHLSIITVQTVRRFLICQRPIWIL